jgi:ribonuclease VapC
MNEVYVLDSYAVLALLGGEAGGEDVKGILKAAQKRSNQVFMSWVNVGEVAYIVERRWGKEKVYQVLGTLEATRIQWVEVGRDLALRAAEIKASYPVAYADAYAAAVALDVKGVLVTGDPELEQLGELIEIQWLPQRMQGR